MVDNASFGTNPLVPMIQDSKQVVAAEDATMQCLQVSCRTQVVYPLLPWVYKSLSSFICLGNGILWPLTVASIFPLGSNVSDNLGPKEGPGYLF